jgi:hypothetical protein
MSERERFEQFVRERFPTSPLGRKPSHPELYDGVLASWTWDAWQACLAGAREAGGWRTVEGDGLPPIDGETVFIGVNTAGFAACFNMMTPDGACLMGTAESCTCVMSCLRWWRALDRPTATPVGPAGRETGYAYPAGKLANHSGVAPNEGKPL